MAVVGEAHVIVRAITNRVRPDIQRAFEGIDGIGEDAGRNISDSFSRGLASGGQDRGGLFSAKFRREAEDARLGLQRLITTGYFLGPAVTSLVGAIGALGGGLLTLGATATAVAAGGLVTMAATLGAVAQAAITAKLAFAGVSEALKAGLKTQKASASNDKAIAAARRRVSDATLKLKRLQTEGKPELLAQLARRQLDAEEGLADARISASRAERTYRDAQEASNKATQQLNKTREDAKEKLQQLRFETEGAAISEKKARLEFIKARDALQRVQDLPPNSRARQEAELAFAEADLNLRKAIDRNKDLKKEEKAATAVGVEGSQAVKDAVIAERNARESAADAAVDFAKSLKSVEDAKKAVAEATDEATNDEKKSKAVRDINRQIGLAVRDVVDAEKELADARKGPGADAFADALAGLSPEAQRFVKYLMSIQGEFKKLRAAAGKELFPKLETAIQNLVDNLFPKLIPLLEGTGSVLGDIAIDFSNTLTEGENLASLEKVWKGNDELLRKLGFAAGNLTGGLLAILDAAQPLIKTFGDWILKLSETFEKTMKAKKASGELAEFFENIQRISSGLGAAFKKGFGSLGDIIDNVIAPGGAADIFVKYLDTTFTKWKAFTQGGAENEKLTGFLNGLTTNFTKILTLVGKIISQAAKIGATPEFGQFIDKLSEAVDIFGEVGDELAKSLPALGDVVVNFAKLVKVFTESGAITTFFKTLSKIFEVITKIFGSDIGQKILAFVGGIFAVYRAFALVGGVAKFVFKAFIGSILSVKKSFTNLRNFITDPFGKLRKGSGLTRTELQKQMVIDKQKKAAMKGIYISGNQAATSLTKVGTSSAVARTGMQKSTVAARIKAGALRGVAGAARLAGGALRFLGGPIGLLLLIVPLIISNWDKIVAFFKDFGPKVLGFFQEFGSKLGTWFSELFTKVSKWFTDTLVPFLISLPGKYIKLVAGFWLWIFDLMGNLFTKIGSWFMDTLVPFLVSLPGKYIKLVAGFWLWIFDLLGTLFTKIGSWFTDTLVPFLLGIPKKYITLMAGFWGWIIDLLGKAFTGISDYFTKTVIPFVAGIPKKFIDGAGKLWDFMSGGVKTAWTAVTNFFTVDIPAFLRGLPKKFTDAAGNIFGFLKSGLEASWASAKAWWNSNVAGKGFSLGGFKVGSYQVPKFDIRIPQLAQGGIIPATQGGVIAQLAEAGRPERVEPLDPDGLSKRDKAMISFLSGGVGKGVTVNVYPSAGMNERELANLVSRQLAYEMRRGAA